MVTVAPSCRSSLACQALERKHVDSPSSSPDDTLPSSEFSRVGARLLAGAGHPGASLLAPNNVTPRCPPPARAEEIKECRGSICVPDSFRWLENTESPDVKSWVQRQNFCTRINLDGIPARKHLEAQFRDIYGKLDSVGSMPQKSGEFYFFKKGDDIWIKRGIRGKPHRVVRRDDVSGKKSGSISRWYPSRNGKLLACGFSEASNNQRTFYVIDMATGKKLPDKIPGEYYPLNITWAPDNRGFYYMRRPTAPVPKGEETSHKKLFYHRLGTNFQNDALVFGNEIKKDAWPMPEISSNGRWLLVELYTDGRSEFYVKDLSKSDGKFRLVFRDVTKSFKRSFYQNKLFIATTSDAPRGKVIAFDLENPNVRGRDIVQEGKGSIENIYAISDRIYILMVENGHSVLRVCALDGKFVRDVPLPDIGLVAGDLEFENETDREFFFEFSSYLFPRTIFRYDIDREELTVLEKSTVKIDSNLFEVRQVWYKSKDGTTVPMFIAHKRGLKLDGSSPALLAGYGGFGYTDPPEFDHYAHGPIIPFLEAGGVYAWANIRGGGELGEEWHKAGMLEKKQNSFDDFIAAAAWLIKNGYANSKKLAALGKSNGGLLVGAVLTQRPDIFKAVVMRRPVTDMLRFHKFGNARLGPDEYGDPEASNAFKYLSRYSPYHNVRQGVDYPAVLIVGANQDDQVGPMHSLKMAARLQQVSASSTHLYMLENTGHGAGTDKAQEMADIWSFIFWQLGMNNDFTSPTDNSRRHK